MAAVLARPGTELQVLALGSTLDSPWEGAHDASPEQDCFSMIMWIPGECHGALNCLHVTLGRHHSDYAWLTLRPPKHKACAYL